MSRNYLHLYLYLSVYLGISFFAAALALTQQTGSKARLLSRSESGPSSIKDHLVQKEVNTVNFYRRAHNKNKDRFWTDLKLRYWLFDLYQNAYTMLPPTMQTGHLAPAIRLGYQRFFLGSQVSRGITWVESTEDKLEAKGSGPVTRMDFFAGITLHEELSAAVGYYSFEAVPTTSLGVTAYGIFSGYYLSINHDLPLSADTRHGLNYNIDIIPGARQIKGVQIHGYQSLKLPEVIKYGIGLRTGIAYLYSFSSPLQVYAGFNFEMFNGKQDVTMFYGPQLGCTYKL